MKNKQQSAGRILLLFSLLCSHLYTAKAIEATSAHTVFYQKQADGKYDANVTLSWRAQASSLHFERDSSGALQSRIIVLLRISTDDGVVKEETFQWLTPALKDPDIAFHQLIIDQYTYKVPAGHYQAELVLFEPAYKDQSYQYTDTFTIAAAPEQHPFLSDVRFLDTFFRSDAPSMFSRNGIIQVPLATNYISEKKDSLKYVVEVYETNKAKETQKPLKLHTYISWRPENMPYSILEQTDTVNATGFTAYTGTFPVDILPSGNYYLTAQLLDRNNKTVDQRSLFLQRFNPNPKKPPVPAALATKPGKDTTVTEDSTHVFDLTTTFVGKYTASQVREVLKMLLLIADAEETTAIKGFLHKPDELYSKYFIFNFWEKRDKQEPTKAWKAYTERIKEVNRLFGTGSKPGYETDRGRLYIQYGKPSDRIQVPNEQGALPYELWQYFRIEKTGKDVIFLLYRPSNMVRDFELLHSTMIGEKRNTNWRTLLYTNSITGNGTVNPDSQAEQYIGNK